MARQTMVRLTDDLDGTEAQATVRFGWDGIAYEIDLTSEHAAAFAAAVRPYLNAARRVGPARRARRGVNAGRGARSGRRVGEQAAIREWARNNGFELADRGRIPRGVLEAYQAAQQDAAPSTGSDPAPTASQTRAAPARKSTGKKHAAAKAAPAKKTTAKRPTARKATAKKTSAPKSAAKKTAAKKTAAKKTAAKKTTQRTGRAGASVSAS